MILGTCVELSRSQVFDRKIVESFGNVNVPYEIYFPESICLFLTFIGVLSHKLNYCDCFTKLISSSFLFLVYYVSA